MHMYSQHMHACVQSAAPLPCTGHLLHQFQNKSLILFRAGHAQLCVDERHLVEPLQDKTLQSVGQLELQAGCHLKRMSNLTIDKDPQLSGGLPSKKDNFTSLEEVSGHSPCHPHAVKDDPWVSRVREEQCEQDRNQDA